MALAGCGGGVTAPRPAPAPPAPPTVVTIPKPAAPVPAVGSPSGAAVPVELHFQGVGPLYQGFFASDQAMEHLGESLGACLADTAQVWVTWDATDRIGRVFLKVPPDALHACLPEVDDAGVDLAPLVPVGRALAAYRDRVSGSFDLRVASFRVGASFTRGSYLCNAWIAGQHPPDGTTWSPCLTTAEHDLCGGDPHTGVLRVPLSGDDLVYARACFRR